MSSFNYTRLPKRSKKRVAIHVNAGAEKHVRSGHPWLFADSIRKQSHEGNIGDHAVLFDRKNRFLGLGLYDATSQIRVKMLHSGAPAQIDTEWLKAKLLTAIEQRTKNFADNVTNGYRLVHGENDGLPDLIIDRYAGVIVIKLYSQIWQPDLQSIVRLLINTLDPDCIVLRLSRRFSKTPTPLNDGDILHGVLPTQPQFLENKLTFNVDPIKGQKTGFFLDQRDNRQRVGQYCKNKTVLNVFAYSGGFSLYAAQAGATSVVSLDISQHALNDAKANFAANQNNTNVANCKHTLLAEDAFKALINFGKNGRKFDVVVVDPPSFASKKSDIENALKAYEDLNRLAAEVVAPAGLLITASCSSRIPAVDFFDAALRGMTAAGRHINIFQETTHADDHPIGFKEGAYLKCLYTELD